MKRSKLCPSEVARLQKYINAHGGQQKVGVAWGVNSSTLSRVINGRHAPSPMLVQKLAESGVVKLAK